MSTGTIIGYWVFAILGLVVFTFVILEQIKTNFTLKLDPSKTLVFVTFPNFLGRIVSFFQPQKNTSPFSKEELERKKGKLLILLVWILVIASCSLGNFVSYMAVNQNISLIPANIQALDGEHRAEMITKISDIGVPAVKPLISAYHDTDNLVIQSGIAEALGQIRDKKAIDSLIIALQDEAPAIRTGAILALRGIVFTGSKEVESVKEPLLVLLNDIDPGVRANAAESLGVIGDENVVEPLIALLEDADQTVRTKAAYALVRLGDERAEAPLMDLFAQKDLAVIAYIPSFYIKRASAGDESVFISALITNGDSGTATVYLNCGNAVLVSYAETWAAQNGYEIIASNSHEAAQWGSRK